MIRLYNEEYARQMAKLKRLLRLSMNGVASESMEGKGAVYKVNYGVSYPRLKEIAHRFPKDKTFAGMLWENDIREMKILATMLYPVDLFTRQEADAWVRAITQLEIAEQACMNLFSALPFAKEKALEWIAEDGRFVKITGYLLISRLAARKQWDVEEIDTIFSHIRRSLTDDSLLLVRTMLQCLGRLAGKDKETAGYILGLIGRFPDSWFDLLKEEIEEDLKWQEQ